jgi:hypothetical protein
MAADVPLPPAEWFQFADGYLSCWWCCALVHPSVAEVHDRWHRLIESDGPVLSVPVIGSDENGEN